MSAKSCLWKDSDGNAVDVGTVSTRRGRLKEGRLAIGPAI